MIPSDLSNLKVWWKADALSLSDGDAVGTWTDSSGLGYDMTQGTAGYKPIYRTNRINGKAAVDFDGVDDKLIRSATNLWKTTWFPNGYAIYAVFKAHSASVAISAYYEAQSIFADTSYGTDALSVGTSGGLPVLAGAHRYDPGSLTTGIIKPCPLNDWHFCHYRYTHVAATPQYVVGVSIDGGPLTDSAATGPYTGTTSSEAGLGVRPSAAGTGWFDGEIAEVFGFDYAHSTSDQQLMLDYIRAKYFPATASQTEQVRDTLSRRLWIRRRPNGLLEVNAPLWMMDAEILDRVYIESPFGPHAQGSGWAEKRWQRRAFSVLRSEPDPGTNTVRLLLFDRRPVDALLWDAGWSRSGGAGAKADGVARFWPGGTRTFTRASRAWGINPADSAQVTAHADNDPLLTYNGEVFEPASTNSITRSSFISGTTGLTVVAGSGGGAAAVDTTVLLFSPEVTPNSFKLTGGTTESSVQFPDTAGLTGNARVSVDHYDDSNGALVLRISRTSDGFYWNDGTGAFVSTTPIDISLPVTQDKAASRWSSKAIALSAQALRVVAAVTVSTRVCHVFHAQAEVATNATSRIVTDGAAVTRAKSRLLIGNGTGLRCVNVAQGTVLAEVIPDWASADIGNTNRGILYAYYDASNYFLLQYNGTSDRFEFIGRRSGVTYTAYKATTVVAGTAYKLAGRWTGIEAELGLSAYTLSCFVDGVKGTDATMSGAVAEVASADLEVGSTTDAENWGGVVRRRLSRPYPMTDEEIGRFEA